MSFILDADIRSFFDEISQDWLIRFLEHRIGDRRIIRLIRKWLKAGILEDGVVSVSDRGTGQGSVISPLLADVYLDYALDLWAVRWRRREAAGDMIIVRYADDFIIGFEHESDARRYLDEMRERLGKFVLTLHPEKTRLIEFGRFAAERRSGAGVEERSEFGCFGSVLLCREHLRRPFCGRRDHNCSPGFRRRPRINGPRLRPPACLTLQRVELRTAPVRVRFDLNLAPGKPAGRVPGPGGAKNSGGTLKTPGLLRLDGVVRGV